MARKDPALIVGPMDPDRVAGLVGRMGVHHNARRLLQRSASIFTPELVGALNKPTDDIRTEGLRAHPGEVQEAAEKAGLDGKVVGASVRGSDDVADDDRVLVVTILPGSGRSYRAVLSYGKAKLPSGKQTAENIRRMRLGLDAQAAKLLGPTGVPAVGAPASGEEAEELRRMVVELEKRVEEATGVASEPYEGYSEDNVPGVEAAIAEAAEGFEREYLKRRIREAEEEREEPRKGVLDATEPVELVPAGE